MTIIKLLNPERHYDNNAGISGNYPYFLSDFPYLKMYNRDSASHFPGANIKEHNDSFVIELEAPGIEKDNLKLDLEKDKLIVRFKDDMDRSVENFTHREFDYRSFERSFLVPDSVDKEKITALSRNGILYINLPKREENIDKGPRTINIS
jgi:HSP20 family protein